MKFLNWHGTLVIIVMFITYITLSSHIEKLDGEVEEESPTKKLMNELTPIDYDKYIELENFLETIPIGTDKWLASQCYQECPLELFTDETKKKEQLKCKFNCTNYITGGCDQICEGLPDSTMCEGCKQFISKQIPLIQKIKEAD